MREREIDEFESLFQRSIVPTIEVSKVAIESVVVLADFSERALACGRIAADLKARFGAKTSVRFLLPPSSHSEEAEAEKVMEAMPGDERRVVEGDPAQHLERIAQDEKPSLIIAPAPLHLQEEETAETQALGRFIDSLLIATPIPTLLVRQPDPGPVFDRILAKIPGGRHDLIEQFSFAFALCAPGGFIRLLHVVEERRVRELAELLEIAPGIDTEAGTEELVAAVDARMDHLLRGAVKTAEGAGFEVDHHIEIGDPFEIVPRAAADFGLLILGSQASHAQFLESRAYELIRRVEGVAVLAL